MINVTKTGFDIEYLTNAINRLMDSTRGRESQEAFDDIFEDMDSNERDRLFGTPAATVYESIKTLKDSNISSIRLRCTGSCKSM
jgi:hypothetical protein